MSRIFHAERGALERVGDPEGDREMQRGLQDRAEDAGATEC